ITENGTVTLSGKLTDPGTLQVHTPEITWGDGASELLILAAGVVEFTATHRFIAEGSYKIHLKVTASDGAEFSDEKTINVTNAPPVMGALTFDPTKPSENGTVLLSGVFADPGTLDTH